jgi:hypothetical protein
MNVYQHLVEITRLGYVKTPGVHFEDFDIAQMGDST